MKLAHSMKIMCLACCAALYGQTAAAADSGWYLGAGIGEARAKIDDARINASLLNSGFASASTTKDEKDTTNKLFFGYKFNRHFALEAGHFDLGEFSYMSTTLPAGTLNGKIALAGWNVDAVGILPLADRLSAFGRLGVQYAQVKDSFAATGAVSVANPNPEKQAANVKFGAGLQYDITDSVGLRGEWERYRVNDAIGNLGDIDVYTLGLIITFGGQKQAVAAAPLARETIWIYTTLPAEKAPPMLAAAPVPLAVVAVVAVAPLIVLEDNHFEFDKSTITPAGRKVLDHNIRTLKDNPNAEIRIAGYTSAYGTQDYNQKLSERRATAVQDYLSKGGIAPNRMTTIGYGEMRPAKYEPIPSNVYSAEAKANMRVLFEVIVQ